MANKEHLTRLENGPETWNKWRKKHRSVQVDLNGANLSGATLRSADLSNATFFDKVLVGIDLSQTKGA